MKYNDSTILKFGQFSGEKLANVPADYLLWLYNSKKIDVDLKIYIEFNMDVLKSEAKLEKSVSFQEKFTEI